MNTQEEAARKAVLCMPTAPKAPSSNLRSAAERSHTARKGREKTARVEWSANLRETSQPNGSLSLVFISCAEHKVQVNQGQRPERGRSAGKTKGPSTGEPARTCPPWKSPALMNPGC